MSQYSNSFLLSLNRREHGKFKIIGIWRKIIEAAFTREYVALKLPLLKYVYSSKESTYFMVSFNSVSILIYMQ